MIIKLMKYCPSGYTTQGILWVSFIMSNHAKTLDGVTEEELRSKQHYYAIGEDAAWVDVYIESVTRALPGPPSHSVK
jgi:hypothetical protein